MPTPRRGSKEVRVNAVGTSKGQATTKVTKQYDYSYGKANNRVQLQTKQRIYQAQGYEDGV